VDQAPAGVLASEASEGATASEKARPEPRRSREHIEIARIASDSDAVREYLSSRLDADGQELTPEALGRRFVGLAEVASEHPGLSGDEFIAMLAQALWGLEPDVRRELLEEQMLPQARSSDVLGSMIRRVDFEEITRMLVDGEQDFDEHRVGLTRALKNLVQVSHADRPAAAAVASEVMTQAGASEETVQQIVAEAVPTRLTVRGNPIAMRSLDPAAGLALQLIDQVPLSKRADPKQDEEVAALQAEAAAGVTESDIVAALVGVAGLESREIEFANTMSVLEDLLGALVARGEFETAAEAAITLLDAAKNPALSDEQRRRLGSAAKRFTRPEDIRRITQALRDNQPGQSQYQAAEKLLKTLGVLAIAPLLEQLADEQDRAERKALVELISRNATRYISELSIHVSDDRWFFVRNVVAILGSTRSPAALGALERTLRHSEARVRRETIRALSMIQDRMSVEMLIAGLSDDDASNVQLAARYLGARGMHDAVFALEEVAKGEGHGNRENGPRIEAMQALAKIGATEALPVLKTLSRKRSIFGAARTRELRTAAAAAVATIKAKGGMK
jgi:HEAT repeats/PBS lyase HEAT-like repeat